MVALCLPRASACVCVTEKGYGLMIDHPVAVISQERVAGLRAERFRVIGARLTPAPSSRLIPTACTGTAISPIISMAPVAEMGGDQ